MMIDAFRSLVARPQAWAWPLAAALVGAAEPAAAQYIDARLIPKGALRIDFSPQYTNFNQRFSLGTPGLIDGAPEPLGADLTADSTGGNVFPSLRGADEAIRAIIGDPTYTMNVGAFNTVRDGDVRHFPFGFTFGLTDRITLRVHIPLVTTRSQVTFTNDTTDANAGLNGARTEGGDATSAVQAAALINELTMAIGQVEGLIAGGSFGCPSSPSCAQAMASVVRAQSLLNNLLVITGLGAGQEFVAFAPLANSSAGQAIAAEIAAVAAELQSLGSSAVTTTLPLPAGRAAEGDVNGVLAGQGFAAAPLAFNRQTKLGDIEVGARFGLLTGTSARAVLVSTVRLPTGRPAQADNFVDIGTGDGQTDIEVGLEATFEPGRAVGLSFAVSYTLQLPHQLDRRVTTPSAPLVPVTRQIPVTRDLGDIIRLSAYPTLRLAEGFSVFALVSYYHKAADSFRHPGAAPTDPLLMDLSPLAVKTKQTALSFGGGIAYRSAMDGSGRKLPIEAGLNYRAAFSGSGGLTPKMNTMQVYLRLFYRIFGNPVAAEAEESVGQR
ncbi:MAG: hypothetical protein O7I93_15870 [Gemmatimonadetes bacterium]|nr:hypothetical protein [Gemmatimonadota bacterium]